MKYFKIIELGFMLYVKECGILSFIDSINLFAFENDTDDDTIHKITDIIGFTDYELSTFSVVEIVQEGITGKIFDLYDKSKNNLNENEHTEFFMKVLFQDKIDKKYIKNVYSAVGQISTLKWYNVFKKIKEKIRKRKDKKLTESLIINPEIEKFKYRKKS